MKRWSFVTKAYIQSDSAVGLVWPHNYAHVVVPCPCLRCVDPGPPPIPDPASLKAPSHQASVSTDGYVPQHFRHHATSMLSVDNPVTFTHG